MTCSEFIEKIKQQMEQHGDVEVVTKHYYDDDYHVHDFIVDFYESEEWDGSDGVPVLLVCPD